MSEIFHPAAEAANPAPKERHSSLKIEVPGGAQRVLLHVCCAPCCGAIVECLQENGIEPVIFFSNSNIYPQSEYEHRRAECERWAAARGVVFVEDEYDHAAWREAVLGLENEPERGRRCSACFRFRLFRAAQYAASHGLTVLTTSLASSRWKNLDQVNEAGEAAVVELVETTGCEGSGSGFDRLNHRNALLWWPQNWRKGGLQERRGQIIREQNFYNQLYCGCEFSLATSPAMTGRVFIP
jgi:epoxyqueuosine reductase